MNTYEPIGEQYVKLALRLERHLPGFVDGYFGPPEFKEQVQAEPLREVVGLRDDAARLREMIEQAEMDAQRREFLVRQVRAMETALRHLTGDNVPFIHQVQGYFDIIPQRVPEAEFELALRELDKLFPGKGDLATRRAEWNRQFELPRERVLPVLEVALTEVRRRTQAILPLPTDESVTLQLVSQQPWSGYNWYLGQNQSRIEINTDLPVRADGAVGLIAHEAYPGHHTEDAIKEQRWYRQAGRLEHSILILMAPESLVAEAIATVAEDVIFPDQDELAAWLRKVLYPAAGITVDVDLQLRLRKLAEKLDGLGGNAAFLLHDDGRNENEVMDYIRHYGLYTEKEARQTLRFISHPLFGPYIFNYAHGRRLLQQSFVSGGVLDVFRWVISEPVTPSTIAARYIA